MQKSYFIKTFDVILTAGGNLIDVGGLIQIMKESWSLLYDLLLDKEIVGSWLLFWNTYLTFACDYLLQ